MPPAPPHPIIAFYRDGARDDRGRTLAEILDWSDDRLESVHDFIQWLFPLPEPSGANPDAPTLDPATVQAFRDTPAMRDRLHQAFERMLRFYGLACSPATKPSATKPSATCSSAIGSSATELGTIDRLPNFSERAQNWLWPMNHNHLRLTRILRSTSLLGLEAESKALFHALNGVYREFPDRITARTHAFWIGAAPGE